MAKAKKKEVKVVAKNYKSVLLDTLVESKSATCMELTKKIQEEIPFLKFESPYKVKAEYVLPTLEKSKCFVNKGDDVWALSDLFLNLENHAFDTLKKNAKPMSYDELTEEIAMKASLHPSDIPLSIDHDERFKLVEIGKVGYYFLADWDFCNDYAFALFVLNKNEGLDEGEIRKSLGTRFKKKGKDCVILLEADPRFREGTDGTFSVFPRLIKRFRKSDVPRSILETIFKRLEEGESAIHLREIGEEFLDCPYPLSNLEEKFAEDLRFSVSREKIKRSKYSLEQIKELKREERKRKKAQKEAEAARKEEEAKRQAALEKEMEALEAQRVQEEEASLPELISGAVQEEEEIENLEALKEKLMGEELGTQEPEVDGGLLSGPLPGVIPAAVAEMEAANARETSSSDDDDLSFLTKKTSVIKKVIVEDIKDFDIENTNVDQEELADYLKELTDHDGSISGLNPRKYDELLCRHLLFKVSDYRPTNPEIADFMVKLARPRMDQIVLDPVCGRGDLLLRVLQTIKSTLRDGNEGDQETFATFLDEQIVGLDRAEFVSRGARLGLSLSGFDIALLETGNSLEDTDILIDEMYTMILGDFCGFNIRELSGYIGVMDRVLSESGESVILLDSSQLHEEAELATLMQERFLIRHQIVLIDEDGKEKTVVHLVKSQDRSEKTKVFRLDSLEQLNRVLDLIY